MAFETAVLENAPDLGAGEVIKSNPHSVQVFEVFEDGLIEGRFAKYDTGSLDKLDASVTPKVAAIVARKVTGEIGAGVYSTTGQAIDSVAEGITYGYATVTTTDAAAPTKYDPVYAINLASGETGKATQDSGATGALAVAGVDFWEQKAANVWLVRIKTTL